LVHTGWRDFAIRALTTAPAGAILPSVPSQLPHYLFNNQPFLTIVSNLFLNVVWNIHT
jgi:hypothetical protein